MLKDFADEKFDIVIQAGQSNAEGCGLGDACAPFCPDERICYLNSDFTIRTAHERVSGNQIVGDFSLSFSAGYIERGFLAPGRKILVVRAAVGGTGFLDNRWKTKDDLFIRMMEMIRAALGLNPQNKLVAFLWHQGETDAGFNADESVHFNHLSTLIKMVRNDFICQSLPFIAGDFVRQWKMKNIKACIPVISAVKNVCADIGNASFVETADLKSNDEEIHNNDEIHFSRDSLNKLGLRYLEAFCGIVSAVKR